MRILPKVVISLGILTLVLVLYKGPSLFTYSAVVQAQNLATLPISLPEEVKVKLKPKGEISGVQLLEINTNTQQIKLEQNGKPVNQDIANIDGLEFKGRAKLKGGRIVMRGGGNSRSNCSNSESWNLPLNALTLKNSSQAELNFSVLPKSKQREIQQINDANRTYVVDEMKFENQGKFTLKTTPCSE